jgi:hypothetical protein
MKFFSTIFFVILAFFFTIAADAQQQDGGGDAGGSGGEGGGAVAAVPPQHLRGLKTKGRARPDNSYYSWYNENTCPYTTYIFCMSKCRSRLYKSIVQCKLENPACAPSSCC